MKTRAADYPGRGEFPGSCHCQSPYGAPGDLCANCKGILLAIQFASSSPGFTLQDVADQMGRNARLGRLQFRLLIQMNSLTMATAQQVARALRDVADSLAAEGAAGGPYQGTDTSGDVLDRYGKPLGGWMFLEEKEA